MNKRKLELIDYAFAYGMLTLSMFGCILIAALSIGHPEYFILNVISIGFLISIGIWFVSKILEIKGCD